MDGAAAGVGRSPVDRRGDAGAGLRASADFVTCCAGMGEATALNQSLTKYNPLVIIQAMVTVFYHDDFADELLQFEEDVQIETEAMVDLLEEWGPDLLKTKYASHLQGKICELRFSVGRQVWRLAYALYGDAQAVVLLGGDKQGTNERRFYKRLIATAARRLEDHLTKENE